MVLELPPTNCLAMDHMIRAAIDGWCFLKEDDVKVLYGIWMKDANRDRGDWLREPDANGGAGLIAFPSRSAAQRRAAGRQVEGRVSAVPPESLRSFVRAAHPLRTAREWRLPFKAARQA